MNPHWGGITMKNIRSLLFVYGTLRRHEQNHNYLTGAQPISLQAQTQGQLFDTGSKFPALIANQGTVYGEVYEVDEQQLARIDQLEGYQETGSYNLFERVKQKVITDHGELEAYVYRYSRSKMVELISIPCGDWKVYRHSHDDHHLFFAYGSMMDDERLKADKKDHLFQDLLGRGIVNGYEVKFTLWRPNPAGGRADLVEGNGLTEGKIFQIGKEALDYLYRREGVKNQVYRPTFIDVEVNGKIFHDAWAFVVVTKDTAEHEPPISYAKEILRGGQDTLSSGYLDILERRLGLTTGTK